MPELNTVIEKAWGLEADVLPGEGSGELMQRLVRRIRFMLKNDYDRLLGRLYLLDIREHDLQRALDLRGEEEKAGAIAEIIIGREAEKIESRKRYLREHSLDADFEVESPED